MEQANTLPKFNPQTNTFTHFVLITFSNSAKSFNFGLNNKELKKGDKVVVETIRGIELGFVVDGPFDISEYKSDLGLKPILRKATDIDVRLHENNLKDARFAMEICRKEVENLNLNMNLTLCEYTLDKSKVIFSYVADERVDFRDLLKVLASKLHTRIELRQIGSRDKAKIIGGIGMCGLQLCCSSFLNEFDGISITRAKNQMLAINIPKLSGHCGKLLCCLKYEDDAYTELKQLFPTIGYKVFIDKIEYTVTSINVISSVVRVESEEDVKVLSLEDFKAQTHFNPNKMKNNQNKKNNKNENK